MKFPAIPFLTKSVSTEFFLALIFESDKISSILFKESDKTLVILASHETLVDLEESTAEDLIVSCDNVISRIEMSLPDGAALEKTIFAVPYAWVEEGKIKPERLAQLKKISQELALTPMGFIVSVEAITAFLQKKEGAPISGIFVELSEKYLTVFIVRGGNIIDVKHGVVEDGVEATVEKLLSQVTKLDVLPSKIILLHNKEAEAISQKFLSHHWTKELPFMHLPQVTILEKGFENEAIINGVASQLNVSIKGEMVTPSSDLGVSASASSGVVDTDTFGFMMDEDVADKKEKVVDVKTPEEEGFKFTEEVPAEAIIKHNGITSEKEDVEAEYEEDTPIEEEDSRVTKASGIAGFFTPQTLSKIPKMIGNGKQFMVPAIALLVVVGFLIAYYTVIVRAKVIVFTDQKEFAQDQMDITLTSNGESSFEDKILKISTLDKEVEGEQSQETTGKKDTGQKSTGTITIFNKSEGSKQIDKGTVVTSSNNLEFTLDSAVTIASTSSFATTFQSASVKVTASSFGKEFNLPSQTNFTVKGISTSDVFGRNDAAFSGGTKEVIQVVAKKDLTALENEMTERLLDKAKTESESSLSDSDALIPMYLSFDFKEKKFDRKENDAAKTVKLNATIVYTLGTYNKDELLKFISSSDEFDVPDEFKLSDQESKITISDIEKSGNDLSAKLAFSAIFKPSLDESEVPKIVAGKGTDDAIKKLKETPGISDASIQYQNVIPFLPQIIPLNPGNISVEVKAQ